MTKSLSRFPLLDFDQHEWANGIVSSFFLIFINVLEWWSKNHRLFISLVLQVLPGSYTMTSYPSTLVMGPSYLGTTTIPLFDATEACLTEHEYWKRRKVMKTKVLESVISNPSCIAYIGHQEDDYWSSGISRASSGGWLEIVFRGISSLIVLGWLFC